MTLAVALVPLLVIVGLMLVVGPWVSRKNPILRQVWRFATLIVLVRYIAWRVTETLPSPEFSFTFFFRGGFLLVELCAFYLLFNHRLGSRVPTNRTPEADRHQRFWGSDANAPLVHVFIPTYNEPERVLDRTLIGAVRLNYPNYQVWLLDDGARPEVAALAARRGVNYLKRPDNRHYKAGNLNHAFEHVMGGSAPPDFIAVFDADFIPRPEFLQRTLALMHDDKTAIVQTPQHFFNPDPFQYSVRNRDHWPDEQRYFFDFRLPMQDAGGLATCCGTSFLVRVKDLLSIGGVPTECVSEDTFMSIKFLFLGKRTVYLNEPLSVGLNPEGLAEFLTQRARWSLGLVQISRILWLPKGKKPTLVGRLKFLRDACEWGFYCVFTYVGILMPIIYWWTGEFVIYALPEEVIFYGAPAWFDGMITYWMSRGRYIPSFSEAIFAVVGFAVLPATYLALMSGGEQKFVVTQKDVRRERVTVHWSILSWLLLAAGLLIVGILSSYLDPYAVTRVHEFRGVTAVLSLQSLLLLLVAILPCIEAPQYRADERFETDEAAELSVGDQAETVRLRDLSAGGFRSTSLKEYSIGDVGTLRLSGLEPLSCRLVRVTSVGQWCWQFSGDEKDDLIHRIYCSGEYVHSAPAWSWSQGAWASLRRAFA